MAFVELPWDRLLIGEEENNPTIGTGLGTLLPVQNTIAPMEENQLWTKR
jgi:hypothetical protein